MSATTENESRFRLECDSGHSYRMSPTQLQDFITSDEHLCSKCKSPVFLSEELNLECHVCSMVFGVASLNEAAATIHLGCQDCVNRSFTGDSINVPNSWYELSDMYHWKVNGKRQAALARPKRADYWEGVIHFCSASAFTGIYNDRCIRANKTGLFDVPAVCLTETPVGNWEEIQEVYGQFGFVFRKRDLIKDGGGPCISISEDLLFAQKKKGFAEKVKPFVNLLRIPSATPGKKKYDYLHHREWRLPHDLAFDKVEPYAVIVGPFTTPVTGQQFGMHL